MVFVGSVPMVVAVGSVPMVVPVGSVPMVVPSVVIGSLRQDTPATLPSIVTCPECSSNEHSRRLVSSPFFKF